MKKNLIYVITFLLISIIMVACGDNSNSNDAKSDEGKSSSNDQEVYQIDISHISAETDPIHKGFERFKEVIEERSDGRIQVNIYGAQQLSNSNREDAEKVQNNIVQMSTAPTYTWAAVAGMDEYMLADFPYLFKNDEEIYKVLDSEIGEKLAEELYEKINVKIFGSYSLGWVKLTNSDKPIKEPKDLEGMKIRTTQSDFYMDLISSWGGNPTPMAYGEVFSGLQQGTVDGMVTTTNLYVTDRFYEVQDYMTTVNPFAIVHLPAMNGDFYNSLPEDLQQLVDEVMYEEYLPYVRQLHAEAENEALEILKENGMEIYELTEEEREVFAKEAEWMLEEKAEVIGKELLESIQEKLQNE